MPSSPGRGLSAERYRGGIIMGPTNSTASWSRVSSDSSMARRARTRRSWAPGTSSTAARPRASGREPGSGPRLGHREHPRRERRTGRECRGRVRNLTEKMEDRVFLVTGANSGIGKATALGLAPLGGTVVMACRSATRGEAARQDIVRDSGNSRVYLEIVDLASEESTRSFAEEFM